MEIPDPVSLRSTTKHPTCRRYRLAKENASDVTTLPGEDLLRLDPIELLSHER